MKLSGFITIRVLALLCATGFMTLSSVGLQAQDEGAAVETQATPAAAPATALDSTPVPPPSGPYPVPMLMRRPPTDYPPMGETGGARAGQDAASGWRFHDFDTPQVPPVPTYTESGGHQYSPRPAAGGSGRPSVGMPTFRPLEPDEVMESSPVSAAEPEQAQKMQSQDEAVKNAPASQPQASTGQRRYGGYPPPRPGYGFGYPPPGYGYPPPGYGYPPRYFGYPAQSAPAPKPAESQESTSTRAPQ